MVNCKLEVHAGAWIAERGHLYKLQKESVDCKGISNAYNIGFLFP